MNIQQILLPVGILLVAATVLTGLKKLLFSRFKRWASKTNATWDDLLVVRIERPVGVLTLIASLAIASQFLPEEIRSQGSVILAIKVALIAVTLWIVDRIITVFFKSEGSIKTLGQNTKALLVVIIRFIVYSLGFLIILDTFGISITPILASLGVGSIAIALALQDTLGNFFSGLYLLVDEPVRLGDFIRLEDGTEGTVQKISWRSTRIKIPTNSLVIIPNSKIASTRLTNYDLPEPSITFSVAIGVTNDSDLSAIEAMICDVGKEVMQNIPGGVPEFTPLVRYTDFTDVNIKLNAILCAKSAPAQHLLRHEFIKAIHKRFKTAQVALPFPPKP